MSNDDLWMPARGLARAAELRQEREELKARVVSMMAKYGELAAENERLKRELEALRWTAMT